MRHITTPILAGLVAMVFFSCSTTKNFHRGDFDHSTVPVDSVISLLPDYGQTLNGLKGKGRAIISEPGNNERVTVVFAGNHEKSLVTIRNSLGIEAAQILADRDSLLIYIKVDKYAQRMPVSEANFSSLNHLASINLIDVFNFRVSKEGVVDVLENNSQYLLVLTTGGSVIIDKQTNRIQQVDQPRKAQKPYSRIQYESYGDIDSFSLPRRITIFSADGTAKIALLMQSLEVNPGNLILSVDLPDNITVYRE